MSYAFEGIPWLLATGQGRSGTTVLTRALAAHPDVCSNRVESNVMKDVLLAGRRSSTMPSRVRQMVRSRDEHDALFREMLTRLLFPNSLWTGHHPPAVLSTFSAMEPETAEYAVELWPQIHFANIVRNGIEVVASRMAHRVLGQHPFEEQCHAWAAAGLMARWGAERDNFTLIRHECLLQPESCRQTMAALLERAGLAPSDAVAGFILSERRNQTRYESESDQQAEDLQSRSERWRQWSPQQRDQFAAICGSEMQWFDYSIPW
jgi:hypothetical protein